MMPISEQIARKLNLTNEQRKAFIFVYESSKTLYEMLEEEV